MTACERCSRPFVRRRLWAKFCTSACRLAAWKERNRTQGEAPESRGRPKGSSPFAQPRRTQQKRIPGPLATVARGLTARIEAGTFDATDPETRAHLAALRSGPAATG